MIDAHHLELAGKGQSRWTGPNDQNVCGGWQGVLHGNDSSRKALFIFVFSRHGRLFWTLARNGELV
jgi:hypothetical protein